MGRSYARAGRLPIPGVPAVTLAERAASLSPVSRGVYNPGATELGEMFIP